MKPKRKGKKKHWYVRCPYCNELSELVTGEAVYPHRRDLWSKRFYMCRPCKAWVGVHNGTTEPLGRLANAELRQAKMLAHSAFDPLWRRGSGKRCMNRSNAYEWLAESLRIPESDCHIGMFDVDTCRKVVQVCRERVKLNRIGRR